MINETSFITKAINYKKFIASRYMAIEADQIPSKLGQFEKYLVSLKYDGHFYTLLYEDGEATLINRNGKILEKISLHKEIEEYFKSKGIKQAFFAGELYFTGDERTRQFEVSTAIANGGKGLKFAFFDFIELDGEEFKDLSYFDKFEKMKDLLPKEGNFHLVEYFTTESTKEIQEYFKEKVDIGNAEGIVVKNEGFQIYKVKPKFTFDAVIVGFAQSDGDRSDLLRDFLLAFRKEDGSYQIFAHLSHGFNDDQRRELLAEYKKKVVESDYIEVARNRLGFQMVKPETVVEFSCLDIINEDSKGKVNKMNLSYDEKEGWKGNYKQTSVSLTIPVFLRFREDKQASIEDVSFKQITEVLSFDGINVDSQEELAKAEIVKRQVFKKESRGAVMVRKFVLIKTNKEDTGDFPAYVFHLTDFSSGRKDPLKKDVKVSNSKEQIENIYAAAIEKNIKKGWEEV